MSFPKKGIDFDPDSIRALAAILTETGLTEIELGDKDNRIRVVRTPAVVVSQGPGYAPAAAVVNGEVPEVVVDDSQHPGAVKSPMVGVAYLSAEPGSPPFVVAGQAVAAGQTLLLIEAMKTYNQIKAPKAGMLARILVHSGSPVEYGEVLMVVE
jgi:acetyl-CoA carboxylase biotin carboxyl carrier protein